MSILVLGGAGYIGSHTVKSLVNNGENVIVLDDLSYGNSAAVRNVKLYVGNYGDPELLNHVFSNNKIEAVFHFAASADIAECTLNPNLYYTNNVANNLTLLNTMRDFDISTIIFSSSAAVFGEPITYALAEDHQRIPTNTYGNTKLIMEWMLESYARAYGLKYIGLRYFNAAGADPSGTIGEDHKPEHHIIPLVIQVAMGQRDHIDVLGHDWPTPDGSCIRDFIHVNDIAQAHILGLHALREGKESSFFNLGTKQPCSVLEIIAATQEITGVKIPITLTGRREGDPSRLICGSDKITQELGWQPKFVGIKPIIETAWNWHRSHPEGY